MLRGWPRAPEDILEGAAPPGAAAPWLLPPRTLVPGDSTEGGVGGGACKALLARGALVQLLCTGLGLLLQSQNPLGAAQLLLSPAAPPERSKDPLESQKDESGSCVPLIRNKPRTLDPAGRAVCQAHAQ